MIKFMQLQRQVQLNTNAQQHLQKSKKKLKLYLLKRLAENGDSISSEAF
jgi:hypothetical protein